MRQKSQACADDPGEDYEDGGDSGYTVEECNGFRNIYYDNSWGGEDAGDGYGSWEGLPSVRRTYQERT